MKILEGEIGTDITIKDFVDESKFVISSFGGYLADGLAMYDMIVDSDIEICAIGKVASAATLPLIASKNRWGTPNSKFMIHNPWVGAVGNADEIAQVSKDLRVEENRVVEIYEKHLSIPLEELREILKAEKFIDANEALRIGLIKEIKSFKNIGEQIDDASNLIVNQNEEKMTEKKDEQLSGIAKQLDKMAKMLASIFKSTKMIVLQDVNGVEIDFYESETEDQISEGSPATVDGQNAQGSYVMPDGRTFVFEDGEVASIEEQASEDVDALKAENEALKAENEALKESKANAESENENVKNSVKELKEQLESTVKEFEEFKNKYSDEKAEIVTPSVGKKEGKQKFSYKRKN